MWRKALFFFLAAAAALCVGIYLSVAGPRIERPWRPGEPLPKDKVKIGVIYMDNAESGYSYAHEAGIRAMQQELGLADNQIIRKKDVIDSDDLMIEHAMRECISEGANIVIATAWKFMDACEKLAEQYPNVVFAHAAGHKRNYTNFTNYFGRIYHARYLGGIVAGMKTKSGKIGFVAALGKENSEVTSGLNAFALGVESVNPDARILVRVTHSAFDPEGERLATQRMLAAGCDVIAQHVNTPDTQIQAEKAGAWGIGYNTDMAADAPNAVLTSVIWNWGAYYTRLVRSVIDGSFSTSPYIGDLKDGMVDITPLNPKLTDAAMQQAVDVAREKIVQGVFNVFDGVLKTNRNRAVGVAGSTMHDDDIINGMSWYYHTIVEP